MTATAEPNPVALDVLCSKAKASGCWVELAAEAPVKQDGVIIKRKFSWLTVRNKTTKHEMASAVVSGDGVEQAANALLTKLKWED